MTMYHVTDQEGREIFKSEDFAAAKRAADTAPTMNCMKAQGSTIFNVEKRERVYTTQTLDEAIKGTPFDPNAARDSGDEHKAVD